MPPPSQPPKCSFPPVVQRSLIFLSVLSSACRQSRLLSQSGLGLLVENMLMGHASLASAMGLGRSWQALFAGHQCRLGDALPLQPMVAMPGSAITLGRCWAGPSGCTCSLLLMFFIIS